MSEALPNFEGLLREALTPVEPPEALVERLEDTLTTITELAADELEAWELSAMRDPRNWARPAAAIVAGSAAGAALVLIRARRRSKGPSGPLALMQLPALDQSRRRDAQAIKDPGARDTQAVRRALSGAELGSGQRMATCYRHPSRETGVSCSNCGRPICPDCMTTTPVGMRCPECANQSTKVVRLRDRANVPRVTYALIAINLIAFLTEEGQFTLFGSSIHGRVDRRRRP